MTPWVREGCYRVPLHSAQVTERAPSWALADRSPQHTTRGARSSKARGHLHAHHQAGVLQHRQAAQRVPRQEALAAGAHQHHLPRVLQQEAVAARHVAAHRRSSGGCAALAAGGSRG